MYNLNPKQKIIVSILIIILLGAAVYFNSLFNPFLWDDEALVLKSHLIKDFKNIKMSFKVNLFYRVVPTNYYRPLQTISYMFDYHIWGLNPLGYHITNVFLHILTALLVFLLIFIFCQDARISLVTSLFFLLHPLAVESVSYISGRADLMVALFLLSSLILFIKYSEYFGINRKICYVASVLCFILSLLSKEMAIIFPVILIFYDIAFNNLSLKNIKSFIRRYIPFVLIDIIYISLRLTVLSFYSLPLETGHFLLHSRILIFFKTIMLYLRILVFPFDIHMKRMISMPRSIFEPTMLLSFLGVIMLVVLIILLRKKHHTMWFFSVWFFVFLFPQSGIYPISAFVADHFLYLPCIGFFFICTSLLKRNFPKRIFVFIVTLFLLFFGFVTFRQNEIWRDKETLYKYILKFSPDSWEVHNNLGNFYLDSNRWEDALDEFQKSERLNDRYFTVQVNIANVYVDMGQYEKAIERYQEIIKNFPDEDLTNIHNAIGYCYASLKRYEEALNKFKFVLGINPDLPSVHFNIAKVYLEQNKNRQAMEQILLVLGPDIKSSDLFILPKPSQDEYLEVIKNRDCIMNTLLGLGILFSKYGLWDYAERAFKKAIDLDPEYADAHYNLGALYFRMGNLLDAKKMWQKVLKLKPDHIYAKEQLLDLKIRQFR
ncbi:MAG: tetratricopeptide repeat protein [Candidatus Omnitrophica bacterium]|nr:tetratricopeptide repeat protein [Candidatus Omnitrophota bacterium]